MRWINEYNWPGHIDVYQLGDKEYAIFRQGNGWYYRGYDWLASAEAQGPFASMRDALTWAHRYEMTRAR